MNKLLFDEGMEEMDRHIDKFYISYELESNSIHAPDGEYLLKDITCDWTAINLYNLDLDVMLECKHKELGLLKMKQLMEKQNERLCKAA